MASALAEQRALALLNPELSRLCGAIANELPHAGPESRRGDSRTLFTPRRPDAGKLKE